MTAAIIDEAWTLFRKTAREQRKLPGSPQDYAEAFYVWRSLDAFQKQSAIQHLRDCDDYSTTHSTPQNYLKFRRFERPLPVARTDKAKQRALDGALTRLEKEKQK